MAVEKEIAKETKNNVIDMLLTLIVEELSKDLNMDPDETFSRFISSKTGKLFYDDESRLWWNGPSYIAEMYKNEVKETRV